MESLLLTVKGMSCAHCKMAVEQALKRLPGVTMADADVSNGTVAVSFDGKQADLQSLKDVLAEAGYEVL